MQKLFISHASEDKDAIVRDLAKRLRNRKFHVWHDEFALRLGDPLRASIDRGLAECDYGIIVLSQSFFAKKWPRDELEGLFSRETVQGESLIFPVWHGVNFAEVAAHSPILAGRLAVDSRHGAAVVASQISATIKDKLRGRQVEDLVIRSPGGGIARISMQTNAPGTLRGFDDNATMRAAAKEASERFLALIRQKNEED